MKQAKTNRHEDPTIQPVGREQLAGLFHYSSLLLLIAVLAVHLVLPEPPFRTSESVTPSLTTLTPESGEYLPPERLEIAGVVLGCGVLGAVMLWAIGCAIAGNVPLRGRWMLVLILLFAGWALLTACFAPDRRSGLHFWLQQVSLLTMGWLTWQLCADLTRRRIVLAVVVGLAAMMAAKGLWQYFVDGPEQVRHFEMYTNEILVKHGLTPGSPAAIAYEHRLRNRTPVGFISLANPFGSMLLVMALAAAGVACDRWIRARKHAKQTKEQRRKDEVHLPTLSAILTVAIPAAVIAVLVLTRSRGAIGAFALVSLVGVGVLAFRKRLAKHWKRNVLIGAALFLAAGGGIVAYGIAKDSLPTKTMTFRWFYWTGGADIIAEKPLLGTGPGNFGNAYLNHRRPAAEEGTKTPHNFIIHALTQYGLPGGILFVAIIAGTLVRLCRPASKESETSSPSGSSSSAIAIMLWVVLGVYLGLMLFTPVRGDTRLLVRHVIDSGIILIIGLLLAFWSGDRFAPNDGTPNRVTRVLLACGLFGFALHNMVTFSLWMSGPAALFWVVAGAAMAMGPDAPKHQPRIAWSVAGLSLAALIAIAVFLGKPVWQRTKALEKADMAMLHKDVDGAIYWGKKAAKADTLDPYTPAYVARLCAGRAMSTHPKASQAVDEAFHWIKEAISRDQSNSSYYRMAAAVLWGSPMQDSPRWPDKANEAIEYMKSASEMDPQSIRLRLDYVHMLLAVPSREHATEALSQLQAIRQIDQALFADSIYHLTDQEKQTMDRLAALAQRIEKKTGL